MLDSIVAGVRYPPARKCAHDLSIGDDRSVTGAAPAFLSGRASPVSRDWRSEFETVAGFREERGRVALWLLINGPCGRS